MRYGAGMMLLAALQVSGAHAAPRVPADPREVLDVLPERVFAAEPAAQAAVSLPGRLAQVDNLLARAHQSGDPRYLGYAEALLQPWLDRPVSDPEALLARARVRQFNHQFAGALADLRQVLARQPGQPEALLLQASIHLVRADYPQARTACQQLRNLSTLTLALICEAQVDGLNGRRALAEQTMRALAVTVDGLEEGQRSWFYLGWGDLALRAGRLQEAEGFYRRLDGRSPVALAALADVWLEQRRFDEVRRLLAPYPDHDGLLLRLALAEQAVRGPRTGELVTILGERFAALRLRGDTSHLREEALYVYALRHDPVRALELARRNWQQQREPADAELYWRIATASRSGLDLALLSRWRARTGLEDVRLSPPAPGPKGAA